MAVPLEELEAQALKLPIRERSELIHRLIVSIDREPEGTSEESAKAWEEEIARRVPISGTKAMHGHALGATGAMEAALCCLAMQNGWIPPTLNLTTPDLECDLDYVPHTGRQTSLNTVLSNSFGFGGINAALVFRSTDSR